MSIHSFDDLSEHFRAFELLEDDAPMRGFSRVVRCALRDWKKLYDHPGFGFSKPFDVRFAKALVKTLTHLVGTDKEVLFGYAEHAEFSLLLTSNEETDSDDAGRGLLCRIASKSAAKLSLLLGDLALFDVRLYQFPSPELVRSFFLWRQRAQWRTSLDRYVWHALIEDGDEEKAKMITSDFGDEEKLEILAQHDMKFEDVPIWQRRGAGIYWQPSGNGKDPTLLVDTTLPEGPAFGEYLTVFL